MCRDAGCLSGVGTFLSGTVPGTVSEYTYWELYCRCVGCLSSVETNLMGNVLQWCRLFKWCQNLPAGHCLAGVQAG